MKTTSRNFIVVAIMIIIYVLLGNARSVQENPIIPGAVVAVNMIVPVLAGILFGPGHGFSVGILGTFLNSFSPGGSLFEFAAVVPHGIMGISAGVLARRFPRFIAAFSLVFGHLLNIMMFLIFGLVESEVVSGARFWYGLAFESLVGIISIVIIYSIYNLAFVEKLKREEK